MLAFDLNHHTKGQKKKSWVVMFYNKLLTNTYKAVNRAQKYMHYNDNHKLPIIVWVEI